MGLQEIYPITCANQNKPKHFLFKVDKFSNKRGYNRTISVFVMNKHKPLLIGKVHIKTVSYSSYDSVVHELISDAFGYKYDNYRLIRKGITVYEV